MSEDCGCKVDINDNYDSGPEGEIIFCPLHQSASRYKEALEKISKECHGDNGCPAEIAKEALKNLATGAA